MPNSGCETADIAGVVRQCLGAFTIAEVNKRCPDRMETRWRWELYDQELAEDPSR